MSLVKILLYYMVMISHVYSYQINLQLTEWTNVIGTNADLQHDCLYISMSIDLESPPTFLKIPDTLRNFRQMTSLCLSEWPSTWEIKENRQDQKFTFSKLAEFNITSEQLYHWSSPIDTVESYQFYLDGLSTSNDTSSSTKVFYNCTSPRFGPQCQYSFPPELEGEFSSLYEFIHTVYASVEYKPTKLSCYQHVPCNLGSTLLCLDWSDICNGFVQCIEGTDEKHCWQMEINECKEDEYRCRNGQCIPLIFFDDHLLAAECLDQSDRREKRNTNPSVQESYEFRRPNFINEEVMTFNSPNYLRLNSLTPNRKHYYIRLMVTHQETPPSDACLSAIYCHLSFFGLETIGCAEKCPIPFSNRCPWPKTINETCIDSEMFYVPMVPIAFGHIYLAYSKQYLVQQTTWKNAPEYICYNEQFCGGFDSNHEVIRFNNTQCRRVQDILPNIIANGNSIEMIFDYINLLHIYLSNCNTILQNDTKLCDNRTMYQCFNSSKCIANIRIFDRYRDCDYGDDEDAQKNPLIDTLCPRKGSSTHFICPITNRCISRKLIRDMECDCGYSDTEQFICPDEDLRMQSIRERISFPTICDGFNDLDSVILDGQNHTDETECERWLCNNTYTRCNGYWDCNDGADEIDCYSLISTLNCSTRSFLCISPVTRDVMCLSMDKGNDGMIDCLGATDEPRLCRYNTRVYDYGFFCQQRTTLSPICIERSLLCDLPLREQCTNYEILKLCQIAFVNNLFTSGLCDRGDSSFLTEIEKKVCYIFRFTPKPEIVHFSLGQLESSYIDKENNPVLISSPINKINDSVVLKCHHGVPLKVTLDVNQNLFQMTCLCLPNYYGNRCQYQNQRVSFTMKLQTFSDSWQTQFTVIVLLIDDSNERIIHSFEQLTYFPIQHCQKTFDIYLVYSTRPKNESKQYSIHIDIYEKLSLDYRGSLLLEIPHLFLPVQRIASVLNIPHKNYNMKNCVIDGCLHGECIRYFDNSNQKTFCRCHEGWGGRFCTIKHECSCSSDSLCHGISANNRSICICRMHKWGPRCLISDEICQLDISCKNNGTCIPFDQHISPGKTFECLCQNGFHGKQCELLSSKIILSFSEDIDLPAAMFIHFIEVRTRQAPERGITFKKIPVSRNPITIYWSQKFHISFVELLNNRYYLISQEKNYTKSDTIKKHIMSSDYCPHVRELFNETFAQLHLIRRIKYFHVPCQHYPRELSCFYDDAYFCLCVQFNDEHQANCFEFNHKLKHDCSGKSVCTNGGQCLQDSSTCPQISMCICPSCFYGTQCQFTADRHSLSLDAILGYHIQPHVPIAYQPMIVKISLVLTIITTLLGFTNGIFSLITFTSIYFKENGCGIYLLVSSISAVFSTNIFLIKFIILIIAQMKYITNHSFLQIQCVSIDFFMRIGLNMDQWLNACIALERATMIIKGVRYNKKNSRKHAKWVIIILLILTTMTNIIDPVHRRLIEENNNDEKRIWCVLTYSSTFETYNVIMNIFHICLPVLINFISASVIIINSARFKSSALANRTYKQHLTEQLKQHRHLLISSFLLFILAIPRVIFIFSSGCMKTTGDSWWFLMAYFISLFPPMLNFVIFVLPSKVYTQQFYTNMFGYRQAIQRRLF